MQEQQHPLQLAIEELKTMPTIDIKGKSYTQVSTRLSIFRKYFPDASIITNLIHDDDNRVVVQAQITIENRIVSTGLSEEFRGNSVINSTSALENAETSSIGRALAGLSLHGNEYASSFEVANAVAKQDYKQSYSKAPNQANSNNAPVPTSSNNPKSKPQNYQKPYQHQNDFSAIINAGLNVVQDGNFLVVKGDGIFENKAIIKNSGFHWSSQNRVWFMELRQAA